jgi:hypothetical protein
VALIDPLLWEGLPFGQPEGTLDFFGTHDLWHRALAAKVPTVQIIPLDNLAEMMDAHDDLHLALTRGLGLTDPTQFALYDIRQRAGWVLFQQIHSLEHQRLRVAAGV